MPDATRISVNIVLRDGDPRPGNAAEITPAVPAVTAALVDTLVGRSRRLAFDGPHGYRLQDEPVWLYETSGAGPDAESLIIHAGMVGRCAGRLRDAGLDVTVTDLRRFGPLFRPDPSYIQSTSWPDREFLNFVGDNPLCRVEAAGWEVAGYTALVAGLYPDAPVVVAVPTRRRVWGLRTELGERLGEKVGYRYSGREGRGRVQVTTADAASAFAARNPFVLVLADAHLAVRDTTWEPVQRAFAWARRVVGFVPPDIKLDPPLDRRLEMLCGPAAYRSGPPRPSADVLFARGTGGRVKASSDPLGRKRAAVWNNARRNAIVCELAAALAGGDRGTLRRHGVEPGLQFLETGFEKLSVNVVVESPEHARTLTATLGWPVADGSDQTQSAPARTVVTALRATRTGVDADVVVRATGDSGAIPVKGLSGGPTKAGPGVVVDVYDAFDPDAKRDTLERVRWYRSNGYRVHMPRPLPTGHRA